MLIKRNRRPKQEPNPVERTIILKEKLIGRLRKEIKEVNAEAQVKIEGIEFRIKMAQTLVDALRVGKKS